MPKTKFDGHMPGSWSLRHEVVGHPGEWGGSNCVPTNTIVGSDGIGVIAESQQLGDAFLIAAAPDMKDELLECRETIKMLNECRVEYNDELVVERLAAIDELLGIEKERSDHAD